MSVSRDMKLFNYIHNVNKFTAVILEKIFIVSFKMKHTLYIASGSAHPPPPGAAKNSGCAPGHYLSDLLQASQHPGVTFQRTGPPKQSHDFHLLPT